MPWTHPEYAEGPALARNYIQENLRCYSCGALRGDHWAGPVIMTLDKDDMMNKCQ